MGLDGIPDGRSQTGNREYETARYAVPHHILRSEVIYGEGFQSPGGLAAFRQTMVPELPLSGGARLVDIGSGLGGAAFHLAAEYAVEVVGLDLSDVMISIAESRRQRRDPAGATRFLHGDIFSEALQPASFDGIYSRDTLLYEPNKPAVFARCAELLKPGGTLVVTDFCQGRETPEFQEYIDVAGYHLPTISEYVEIVSNAGFTDVVAKDLSAPTGRLLRADLDAYLARTAHDPAIDEADAEHLADRWRRKIGFIEAGALTEGMIRAVTPT